MPDPRLEVIDVLGHRVVVIDKPSFSIGRRSSNDLHLTGTDVSREHAEIVHVGGRYVLRDRGGPRHARSQRCDVVAQTVVPLNATSVETFCDYRRSSRVSTATTMSVINCASVNC